MAKYHKVPPWSDDSQIFVPIWIKVCRVFLQQVSVHMKKTNQLYQTTAIRYSEIAVAITVAGTQGENPKIKVETGIT